MLGMLLCIPLMFDFVSVEIPYYIWKPTDLIYSFITSINN